MAYTKLLRNAFLLEEYLFEMQILDCYGFGIAYFFEAKHSIGNNTFNYKINKES